MFSKSPLIPPRYLFADRSFQSIKAAAISDLYLLNENTNGSSGFLAWRQGRWRGGGCCIQLQSEEPSSQSEAVKGKDAEKHQCQQGMGLESKVKAFSVITPNLYNLKSSLGSLAEGFQFVSENEKLRVS